MDVVKSKKILYFVAEADYFCSHRLHIALAAQKASMEVALLSRCSLEIQQSLEAMGIKVFPLHHFKRGSLHPWHQIRSLLEIYAVYRDFKPDIVHQVALKPVIFGSWIARLCGIKRVINALPGLGYLFTDKPSPSPLEGEGGPKARVRGHLGKNLSRKLVLKIFKHIFSLPHSTLILQNTDDQQYLIQHGALTLEQSVIIAGSGVNLDHYKVMPFPVFPPVRIVCIARLLWHKGIKELAEAADILKAQGHAIDVVLYGLPDPENPSSIPSSTLEAWQGTGTLRWEGHCVDVAEAYANAHIAVLPSYREGLPKSLLEAASCGRPIVSTTVPGCREVVQSGENGFLVPPYQAQALAQALALLIQDPDLCHRMGLASRARAEGLFSDTQIQAQTLTLYH